VKTTRAKDASCADSFGRVLCSNHVQRTWFPCSSINIEGGVNYQAEQRSGSEDVENFYFRLAGDLTWKLTSRLTWVQKAELFSRTEHVEQFRARLSSTLSLPLWKNLSFNLSVLDLYDTDPTDGVDKNEVQIRSLVGITF